MDCIFCSALVTTAPNNNANTPLALLFLPLPLLAGSLVHPALNLSALILYPSQILLDLTYLLPRGKEIQDLTVLFHLHGQFLEDFFLKNNVRLLFHLSKLVGQDHLDPSLPPPYADRLHSRPPHTESLCLNPHPPWLLLDLADPLLHVREMQD